MADESFTDNLLRAIAAEVHVLTGLIAAREMFGKSYFSLGVSEKVTVDQTVLNMVAANYQNLTPELLASQKAQEAMGFRVPTSSQP
jgi:hypothetical protein